MDLQEQIDSRQEAYDNIKQTAGATSVFVVMEEGTPDPEKPWETEAVEVNVDVFAVFLRCKEKTIAGSTVLAGEQKVLISPLDITLTRKQAMMAKIIRGDEVWTVNAFERLRPGTIDLLYTLKVTS